MLIPDTPEQNNKKTLFRMRSDGSIEGVQVKDSVFRDIMSHPGPERVHRLGAYFAKVIPAHLKSDEEKAKDVFMRDYNRIECFYCKDTKHITIPVHSPIFDRSYDTAFLCTCNEAKTNASKISELVTQQLYTLSCALELDCTLENPLPKCHQHFCGRFGSKEKRHVPMQR